MMGTRDAVNDWLEKRRQKALLRVAPRAALTSAPYGRSGTIDGKTLRRKTNHSMNLRPELISHDGHKRHGKRLAGEAP